MLPYQCVGCSNFGVTCADHVIRLVGWLKRVTISLSPLKESCLEQGAYGSHGNSQCKVLTIDSPLHSALALQQGEDTGPVKVSFGRPLIHRYPQVTFRPSYQGLCLTAYITTIVVSGFWPLHLILMLSLIASVNRTASCGFF